MKARPSASWIAPVYALVERDLVWDGYIDPNNRGKPLPQKGIDEIEREMNDFHAKCMNSPPKTSSLKYCAQASLKYPTVA